MEWSPLIKNSCSSQGGSVPLNSCTDLAQNVLRCIAMMNDTRAIYLSQNLSCAVSIAAAWLSKSF